jgi:hypothetical protein
VNLKKNLLGIAGVDWLTISWWEFFFNGPAKRMLTKKQGPLIALEAPNLRGPVRKIPLPYMASPPMGISNIELIILVK